MYDLKLFSKSLDNYVSKLVNGSFEVKIPIKDEYKNKNLVAYYVWGRKSNNSDAEYYINPKLYELSQEQKQRIKNEYTQVREPALIATLDDVKSMKIK